MSLGSWLVFWYPGPNVWKSLPRLVCYPALVGQSFAKVPWFFSEELLDLCDKKVTVLITLQFVGCKYFVFVTTSGWAILSLSVSLCLPVLPCPTISFLWMHSSRWYLRMSSNVFLINSVFAPSGTRTEIGTGTGTRTIVRNRSRALSLFRCNVKAFTLLPTTYLVPVALYRSRFHPVWWTIGRKFYYVPVVNAVLAAANSAYTL